MKVGLAWMCVEIMASGPMITNLCGVCAGTTSTWPPTASSCSSPTVNSARPCRMTNVSEYGCRCSRGPEPTFELYVRMSETSEPIEAPSIDSCQYTSS